MVALGVVALIIIFVSADVGVRAAFSYRESQRKRKERLAMLDRSVKLQFASEAKSLKSTVVSEPLARILAVDDEDVVLDSLRKILVLGGYSVDTVANGSEALTLLRDHDYDFVFTDLKMPQMDGVEVVRAVKQLRPEIDVIVVTGYASIETAIDTMKYGALDYIQKPFTEDELLKIVRGLVIKRESRLSSSLVPKLHVVTPSNGEADITGHFKVMSGFFVTSGHCWATIDPNGAVRVGLDDFAQKILGSITAVELPVEGQAVRAGKSLFSVRQGEQRAEILSPVTGKVCAVNAALCKAPEMLNARPYDAGWVLRLEPSDLGAELESLKIGSAAVSWYQEEIKRYLELQKKRRDLGAIPAWSELAQHFLSHPRNG